MRVLNKLGAYTFLSIAALISIFPFFWMIVSSTNPSVDITRGRMIPGSYLIENFRNLMDLVDFGTAFLNSVEISVITTVFALVVASLAGYGFEIHRSRSKDFVFKILLGSMMIPFVALMVPLFSMFANISGVPIIGPIMGVNTTLGVVLPTFATAFLIFFFRQSTKMFPKEIIEAGRIDGLGELGIFFRIFVPTMKTTYAAAGIIVFMTSWNAYLWPLIIISTPDNQTLPLLISVLNSGYAPDFGVIMLGTVLATLPTAVVFFVLQKHFVAGMMGSVK